MAELAKAVANNFGGVLATAIILSLFASLLLGYIVDRHYQEKENKRRTDAETLKAPL